MGNIPDGWTVKRLTELLDAPQIAEVEQICKSTPDETDLPKKLMAYLKQFDSHLQSKGVHYRFLAFWITHAWSTGKGNNA